MQSVVYGGQGVFTVKGRDYDIARTLNYENKIDTLKNDIEAFELILDYLKNLPANSEVFKEFNIGIYSHSVTQQLG